MQAPGEALLIRMWDTVFRHGIGGLLRPLQTRRIGRAEADVKAYEIRVIAEAERDAEAIRSGGAPLLPSGLTIVRETADAEEPSSYHRLTTAEIVARTATEEQIRREVNVARALIQAAAQLAGDDTPPPDEKPDEDWLFRWRDAAASVSSESLQQLWGRVLAGEFKSPGSTSLRTVDFLRNISTAEAEEIETFAPFVLEDNVIRDEELWAVVGLPLGRLLAMQELGLLSGVATDINNVWRMTEDEHRFSLLLAAGSLGLRVSHDDRLKRLTLPVYPLTAIGTQVLRLAAADGDIGYVRGVGRRMCKMGFAVSLVRSRKGDVRLDEYEEEDLCEGPTS